MYQLMIKSLCIILISIIETVELIRRKFYFIISKLSLLLFHGNIYTQPTFTCSKLTIETLEQGVKYVQS